MKLNILLDDERSIQNILTRLVGKEIPNNPFLLIKNYTNFTAALSRIDISDIEMISFDHDLGQEAMQECIAKNFSDFDYNNLNGEKTGLDCIKWMVDFCIVNNKKLPPLIYYHTANPIGKLNMESYILSYLKTIANDQTPQ